MLYYNIVFFSFRCICWRFYRYSNKLSRIEIWCSFPSISYICSHKFREWWRSLLGYYYNNYFWCVHFKALNDISVSYILLNDMIKNQEALLYLDSLFINWGRTSIYPNYFLFFSLPLCCHSFRTILKYFILLFHHTYSSTSNLNNLKDINGDSIWCNF